MQKIDDINFEDDYIQEKIFSVVNDYGIMSIKKENMIPFLNELMFHSLRKYNWFDFIIFDGGIDSKFISNVVNGLLYKKYFPIGIDKGKNIGAQGQGKKTLKIINFTNYDELAIYRY